MSKPTPELQTAIDDWLASLPPLEFHETLTEEEWNEVHKDTIRRYRIEEACASMGRPSPLTTYT